MGFSTVHTRLFEEIDVEDVMPKIDGDARLEASNEVKEKPVLKYGNKMIDSICYRFTDSVGDLETHQLEREERTMGMKTRQIRDRVNKRKQEKKDEKRNTLKEVNVTSAAPKKDADKGLESKVMHSALKCKQLLRSSNIQVLFPSRGKSQVSIVGKE